MWLTIIRFYVRWLLARWWELTGYDPRIGARLAALKEKPMPDEPRPIYWCRECDCEYSEEDAQDMGYVCGTDGSPFIPAPGIKAPREGFANWADNFVKALPIFGQSD